MPNAVKLFLIDEAHAKWMSSALYGTEGRFQLKVDNVKPLKFVKPNNQQKLSSPCAELSVILGEVLHEQCILLFSKCQMNVKYSELH